MKTISIMITSYNLEDYIDNSIQSIVQQEMPCGWELLIGDDGSTDKTVEHLNKWVKQYPNNITLFQWRKDEVHSMNGFRAAANRAKLLERAKGDYLIYLDGDDCWIGNDKIKRQFELLESPEYTECSCCGHNIYKYNVNDRTGYNMVDARYHQRMFTKREYYQHGMYIHTNTILFRNTCKELMLDSLYRGYLNDVFITFCMLQYGSMLYLPEAYAQYNITGTGLWTGGKKLYGRFRNMHIYDLECKIDPKLESLIFRCLCTNMEVILKEYTINDIDTITPLVTDLDPDVFKTTLLLHKLENLTTKERFSKKMLRIRILLAKISYHWNHLSLNLFNNY